MRGRLLLFPLARGHSSLLLKQAPAPFFASLRSFCSESKQVNHLSPVSPPSEIRATREPIFQFLPPRASKLDHKPFSLFDRASATLHRAPRELLSLPF